MKLKILMKSVVVVLVLMLSTVMVYAQTVSEFTFQHIGQAEGMHSQRIYSIQQTSDGAIWWASKSGIERFNGIQIKHYQLGDPNVFSDFAGKEVYLCSRKGKEVKTLEPADLLAFDNKAHIYAFDAVHDRFNVIADVSQHSLTLHDILPTDKGFWLATDQGIHFYSHQDKRLIKVVADIHVNDIIPTPQTLLFCAREGVFEYRHDAQTLPTENSIMPKIIDCDVESGYYDRMYNRVWLGGYASGIRVLSLGEGDNYHTTEIGATHNPVRVFFPYDTNTMLVGIDGMGIYKFDRRPQPSDHYQYTLLFDANDGPHGVLHGNGIYTMMRDIWGDIVVGSYSGGIDIARPVVSTVAVFQHIPNSIQSVLNDHVNCVAQTPSGKLLMGTDNGVSIYDAGSRSWTHCCQGTVVLDLIPTIRGTMLAATYGQGVLEITENGQTRPLYTRANGTLQDDHIFTVFYDRDGHLWIGGLDGDLVQLKDDAPIRHPIHYVMDMLQLPDGHVAVGTSYGLFMVDPTTGKQTELAYKPTEDASPNRFIHTLMLNDNRELWIGTDGGGIYIYDFNTKNCRHLTTQDGLPSNYVNSILKDSRQRIMIATEQGLAFADPRDNNRIIGVNYCYGVDREYTGRAAVNLTNGHVMLGSTTGALVINPDHIKEIDYTAKLNLVGVNCDEETDDDFKEQMHQQLADHTLHLPYSMRTFELYFEAINLPHQSDLAYQYKVDNGNWSNPSQQQFIRFTSMESGAHILTVRCVSLTCRAEIDEVTLTIHIGRPWWNSWWMWLVYLCLLAAAFYAAWRVYQLHTKYMRLVVTNPNLANLSPVKEEETEKAAQAGTAPTENDTHTPQPNDEGTAFISRATQLVIDNISDSDFNIDSLCREMAMSRTMFYVRLKSYTGKSPQDFIRVIRLERAAALLRSGHPVADAAALAGFDNPKYFSTVFKKYFGVSPSKY